MDAELFRNCVLTLGVVVAIVSVWSARVTARKKQAADLLASVRQDEELVAGLRKLAELHRSPDTNIRAFALQDRADTPEAKSIRYVLNHWEYVSVGIQSGIYDNDMLHKASYNTVINLYKYARPFIEELREKTGRKSLYQEVQWLAESWDRQGLPKKSA